MPKNYRGRDVSKSNPGEFENENVFYRCDRGFIVVIYI